MDSKLHSLICAQVGKEISSATFYLSLASDCLRLNMPFVSRFFLKQADEEFEHSIKQSTFLIDQNMEVKKSDVSFPTGGSVDHKEVAKKFLEHEEVVTKSINEILKAADAAGEYQTYQFFLEFAKEQAEELKNAYVMVRRAASYPVSDFDISYQ